MLIYFGHIYVLFGLLRDAKKYIVEWCTHRDQGSVGGDGSARLNTVCDRVIYRAADTPERGKCPIK